MNSSEKTRSLAEYSAIFLIIISFVLVLFGRNMFSGAWGLSTLHFLPDYFTYIWSALVVLALIPLLLKKTVWPLTLLEKHLWEDKYGKIKCIWALVLLIAFILLRQESHFWGNGYLNIANLAQRAVIEINWYEYGAVIIPLVIYKFLALFGITEITAAAWAYRLLSFASGIIYTIYAYRLAAVVIEDNSRRTGLLLVLLFGSQLMYFMGMIENYILLPALAMMQFNYAARRHTSANTNDLLKLLVVTALGVFINSIFICTLPAVIYSALNPNHKNSFAKTKSGMIAGLIVVIVGIAVLYWKASQNILWESWLLHLTVNPATPYYEIFSIRSFSEILNMRFLLIPLVPLFAFAVILNIKYAFESRTTRYLFLLLLGQIVATLVTNPPHGMARELAFFGFLNLGIIFWGAYSLAGQKLLSESNFISRIAPTALIIIIPFMAINHSPEAGINFLKSYLDNNETKYNSALLAFRDYYLIQGKYTMAEDQEIAMRGKASGKLESDLVNDLYFRQRYDDAMEFASRLVTRFPYNAHYRLQYGNILKYFNRFTEAEEEIQTALLLDRYDPTIYHYLSELYREKRLEHKCLEVLNLASEMVPNDSTILVDYIGYYYRTRDYIKADSIVEIVLENHPGEPYGYMYKGLLSERIRHPLEAADNYIKFIDLDRSLPEIPIIRERLGKIAPQRLDSLDAAYREKIENSGN